MINSTLFLQVTSVNTARCFIVIIFILSVLINLPWYWMLKLKREKCQDNSVIYVLAKGSFRLKSNLYKTYTCIYFITVVVVPLIVLIYCNVFMILALRRAARRRSTICASTANSQRTKESFNGTTCILILFIIAHIVLVAPAEIANFFRSRLPSNTVTIYYNLIVACLNTLQTAYFALNFLLYCAINAQFRQVFADTFFHCHPPPARNAYPNSDRSSSVRQSKTNATLPPKCVEGDLAKKRLSVEVSGANKIKTTLKSGLAITKL